MCSIYVHNLPTRLAISRCCSSAEPAGTHHILVLLHWFCVSRIPGRDRRWPRTSFPTSYSLEWCCTQSSWLESEHSHSEWFNITRYHGRKPDRARHFYMTSFQQPPSLGCEWAEYVYGNQNHDTFVMPGYFFGHFIELIAELWGSTV